MQSLFAIEWTFSAEDSPANHSVMQGNERVQKILDTCSQISSESSWSVNPVSSSSKMSKGLFQQNTKENPTQVFSNMSWKDWRKWVTEQRQEYSQRLNAERLIKENESLSQELGTFPTPTASDMEGGVAKDVQMENGSFFRENANGVRWGVKLRDAVNWPTPDATNASDGVPWEVTKKAMEERRAKVKEAVKAGKTKQGSGRSPNLAMSVQKWATPQVTDATRGGQIRKPEELTDKARQGGCRNLREDVVNFQADQKKSNNPGKHQEQSEVKKLSPLWVAQLMGLPTATWCVPLEWILSDSSETE
tara:strand:- start:260 stop:1174 length:915 start_codon:yes stop_codon:yes gene_type:complete